MRKYAYPPLALLLSLLLVGCGAQVQPPTVSAEITSSAQSITYETKTEVLPYPTVYLDSGAIAPGKEVCTQEGKDGVLISTFETVSGEDGVVSSTLISQERTDPIPRKVTRGKAVLKGTAEFCPPLAGELRITSYFGWRTLQGVRDYHYGIDLAAPVGREIYASDHGVVAFAGTLSGISASYGKLVIIDHQNGYRSYYAHLSEFAVKTGDTVYAGDPIGKVGMTGNTTGPHLHFEIHKNGTLQNPLDYLN